MAHILSLSLGILGLLGTAALLILAGVLFWHYWDCPKNSFRWHMRNQQLKHLSALACLFFCAMTASYAILLEVWAIFYLMIALKVGTWWLRLKIIQHR